MSNASRRIRPPAQPRERLGATAERRGSRGREPEGALVAGQRLLGRDPTLEEDAGPADMGERPVGGERDGLRVGRQVASSVLPRRAAT